MAGCQYSLFSATCGSILAIVDGAEIFLQRKEVNNERKYYRFICFL